MYMHLGVDQIGVWSIVLASTSVSRLADLGLSASVVRHVARAVGEGDNELVGTTIESTTVSLAVLMGAVLCGSYFPLRYVLEFSISSSALDLGLQILPYALVSLWVSILSTVFLGGLDGHQRIDLRATVVILSVLLYLVLAVALVPRFGLMGIAYAQIAQALASASLSWLMLRRVAQALPLLPLHWKWRVLKPMIGYGLNMQIIAVMSFLFDPVTKLVMGKLGGMDSLGYYEMASKLVLQFRSLVVEANRVVIPIIAGADSQTERYQDKGGLFFLASYQIVFFCSVVLYSSLSMLMPAISVLWTGDFAPKLVIYGQLLISGWFINTLIGPAFFSNVGTGQLRDNVVSQAIIGAGGSLMGCAGGLLLEGIGVVTGVIVGLVCGSIYLLWRHVKSMGLEWPATLLPKGMLPLVIGAIFGSLALNQLGLIVSPVNALIAIPVFVLLWNLLCAVHPVSRELIRQVRQ